LQLSTMFTVWMKKGGLMNKKLRNMDWGVGKKTRDNVDSMPSDGNMNDIYTTYMTTGESARYLRRSVSWMSRQKDIPVYRGRPNVFRRDDLDAWMTKNRRYEPLI